MKSAIFLLKSGNPILTCTLRSPLSSLTPTILSIILIIQTYSKVWHVKTKKNTQLQHTSKIIWAQAIAIAMLSWTSESSCWDGSPPRSRSVDRWPQRIGPPALSHLAERRGNPWNPRSSGPTGSQAEDQATTRWPPLETAQVITGNSRILNWRYCIFYRPYVW